MRVPELRVPTEFAEQMAIRDPLFVGRYRVAAFATMPFCPILAALAFHSIQLRCGSKSGPNRLDVTLAVLEGVTQAPRFSPVLDTYL